MNNTKSTTTLEPIPWVEDENILTSIFSFSHLPSPQIQDSSESFLSLLEKFVDDMNETQSELSYFCRAIKTVNEWNSTDKIKWYPEYGAAILEKTHDDIRVGTTEISVLALDNWNYTMHHGISNFEYGANCDGFFSLSCVEVPTQYLTSFYSFFCNLLKEAKQRKGNDRRSGADSQGHQKTPSFIHSVLKESQHQLLDSKDDDSPVQPRGGFTDVGKHTGGKQRATSWPLICSAVEEALNFNNKDDRFSPMELPKIEMIQGLAYFKLWLMERQLDQVSVNNASFVHMSAVVKMLKSTVATASDDMLESHPSFAFETVRQRCQAASDKIIELTDKRAWHVKEFYSLQLLESSNEKIVDSCVSLSTSIPHSHEQSSNDKENLHKLRKQSEENLNIVIVVKEDNEDLQKLLRILEMKNSSYSLYFNFISSVERTLLNILKERQRLSLENIQKLYQVVVRYEETLKIFFNLKNNPFLKTELKSRKTLILWAAYCIVHRSCYEEYDKIQEYRIPLKYEDLRYLVLSSKILGNIVEEICLYIERVNNRSGKGELFSTFSKEGTFDFADKYVRNDKTIQEKIEAVRTLERKRKDDHWDTVKKQKRQLREARDEVEDLETEYWKKDMRNQDTYWTKRRLNNAEDKVKRLKKPPDFLVQPLPEEPRKERQVTFFALMPEMLQYLANLTCMAQDSMIPEKILSSKHYKSNLVDHLRYYSENILPRSSIEFPLRLAYLSRSKVPEKFGPSSLDDYISAMDGVWHPNDLFEGFLGYNTAKDPFKTTVQGNADVADYFTETLPNDFSQLQFALHLIQHGESETERGNRAIAYQDQIADRVGYTIPEFLTYGNLRAFPRQQLRKLCTCLRERSLRFSSEAVRTLIKMIMYNIGEISIDGSNVLFDWKYDLDFKDLVQVMRFELKEFTDEISESPRRHESLLSLIGVTNFFADMTCGQFREISRNLSDITFKFAEQLEERINSSLPKEKEVALRIKQCLFYMYSLLSYENNERRTLDDIRGMCKCIVLIQEKMIFDSKIQLKGEITAMNIQCQKVMARHISNIIDKIDNDTISSTVKTVLHRIPQHLQWERIRSTCCFEAVSDQSDLYSVNLMDGTVLLNGSPPSSLPQSIRTHPLFKRSFDQLNFQTVRMNSGELKTVKPINKKYEYTFKLDGEELIIKEREYGNDDTTPLYCLELLNIEHSWSSGLPERLLKMHSHWMCREKNLVLFRGVFFSERTPLFVLHFEKDNNHACYHIPWEIRSKLHWNSFLEKTHQFKRLLNADQEYGVAAHTLQILNKFENNQFIHIFVSHDLSVIEFSLPRFGLTFEKIGNKLNSKQHKGYHLPEAQQFCDSLREFTEYLVLERSTNDYESCMHAQTAILVPKGRVRVDSNNSKNIFIEGRQECDASREYHKYEIHSHLGFFTASNIGARLQLAAIYAAVSTGIPEPQTKITAEESAMDLVRQCWQNEPFQEEEQKCLLNITEYDYKAPSISLLCYDIYLASLSVAFLHGKDVEDSGMIKEINRFLGDKIDDWKNAYSSHFNENIHNNRIKLSVDEEKRLLGKPKSSPSFLRYNRDWETFQLSEDGLLTKEKYVKKTEKNLSKFVSSKYNNCSSSQEFPFPETKSKNNMEKEMIVQLKDSWEIHQSLPEIYLNHATERIERKLRAEEEEVEKEKEEIENKLMKWIDFAKPKKCSWPSKIFELRKLAFLERSMSLPSLIRLGWKHNELIYSVNPFLSPESKQFLYKCSILWMQLITLQDKLTRIRAACIEEKEQHLIQELRATREWKIKGHERWLAFEVESRLQIRPEQYIIAKELIKNPKTITQLNMGQGKTRVILPMLAMHYSRNNEKSIIRLNFLSQLLLEAKQYLHRILCASVIDIKVFTLPFQRQVPLTLEKTKRIYQSLIYCQRMQGILLVAPEHRLSLSLKRYDIEQTLIRQSLQKIEKLEFIEIFDEADEVLDFKFQLRYAVGDHGLLSSGTARWHSAEALLELFHRNDNIQEFLKDYESAYIRTCSSEKCAMDQITFINNDKLQQMEPKLHQKLAEELLKDPPYEFRWFKKIKPDERDKFIRYMTETEMEMSELEIPSQVNKNIAKEQLLALRGMLAFSLIFQCLQKRWDVEYGIAREQERFMLKRMAIPFRATATPSPRAEFAHPDVLIILTLLSYYYTGLALSEVKESLLQLLKQGKTEQEKAYDDEIFPLSKPDIQNESHRNAIDGVAKIDLTNEHQLILIHQYMHKNVSFINFFLNQCVFKKGTQQYPQRIEASAWNLVGSTSRGFSGTNDNHFLLPHPVKQQFLKNHKEIFSTNGKMLKLVLQNDQVRTIPTHATNDVNERDDEALWQKILNDALENNAQALIDAGALMAGTTSEQIYRHLLDRIQHSDSSVNWKGVVFFSSEEGWKIATQDSVSLLNESPIKEKETFVYFDENHCRGADMKLEPDALGIITIGPNTTKDKLMQAAGRMRQLDAAQKIQFVLIPPIAKRIKSLSNDSELTSKQLLQYVIHNTMEANVKGIVQWAHKGLHYSYTAESDEFVALDEKIELQTLYEQSAAPMDLKKVMERKKQEYFAIQETHELNVQQDLIKHIEKSASDLVSTNVTASNTDEECERETQKENEYEEEEEVQILREHPAIETQWEYRKALEISSSSLQCGVFSDHCYHLSDFVNQSMPQVKSIQWQKAQIYVTPNFAFPVGSRKDTSQYLRPIDAMLVFLEGDVLLLSEFEAESFLRLGWENTSLYRNCWFVNYCYAQEWYCQRSLGPPPLVISSSLTENQFHISDETMAALRLFKGETKFKMSENDSLLNGLRSILESYEAKQEALIMPELRHTSNLVRRSDLEQVCEE
eukprot:gb/GECH01010947.1/.p1 GENE.gb/GECH01010947.1/~~gb/GECH01010947.1/.p1  ORF type:complete len:2826 (+),score=484.10 gb/GECH01010947.1/:1-8478(+)